MAAPTAPRTRFASSIVDFLAGGTGGGDRDKWDAGYSECGAPSPTPSTRGRYAKEGFRSALTSSGEQIARTQAVKDKRDPNLTVISREGLVRCDLPLGGWRTQFGSGPKTQIERTEVKSFCTKVC